MIAARDATSVNLGRAVLPPRNRPDARLTILDVTKWFGETSGGVRTYLNEKSAYVRRNTALRHVLAIPGATDEIIDDDGVRTYRLRGPRIPTQPQYRFLLATRSLRRIVVHERPDVIEVGSQVFVPWVARLANHGRRTPLVSFYHGNIERNASASLRLHGAPADVVQAMARCYLRVVDGLFSARLAASESMASDLHAAGVGNVTRVRLGVDSETFNTSRRQQREATRLRHGIPTDARVVIYCGRMATEKDIPWLVRAWPAAWARTGAWLVLVGDGPLKESLAKESRAEGRRIVWLPFEPDRGRLANLLACADVAVTPGPIETFGLSALEAMACGTPVLSTDRGAGAELVRASGAGATYRMRDARAFAEALSQLLGGDLNRLGDSGRSHAVQHHDWDDAFDHLFSLYERLAAR